MQEKKKRGEKRTDDNAQQLFGTQLCLAFTHFSGSVRLTTELFLDDPILIKNVALLLARLYMYTYGIIETLHTHTW